MIVRFILFVIVFFIGWTIYRQIGKLLSQKASSNAPSKAKESDEAMVKCVHCGTYVPVSHAIYDHQQQPYCSVEHKTMGPAE